jgi:hypothetical protein
MPDISTTLLTDIKLALDDALRLVNPVETEDDFNPSKAVGNIVRVRAEVERMLGNNVVQAENSDIMRRQRGNQLLRELDRVRRAVREDYGIKDAA